MLDPFYQWFDNNGDPLNAGTLTFYQAGTSTLLDTYSDVALATPNSNPLTLDSAGRSATAIFFSAASYKVVLKTSAGVTIATRDNVAAVPNTNVDLDIQGTAGETLSAGDCAYLSAGDGGLTAGRWYKTDADQAYSSVSAGAIAMVPTGITSGNTGSFRLRGRVTGMGALGAGSKYFISTIAGALTTAVLTNARYVGIAESSTVLIFDPNALFPGPNDVCNGRLTLESGVAVSVTDQTAKTSVYFTPYKGDKIALYNGVHWQVQRFTELTLSLSGLTANLPYDVYCTAAGGVPVLGALAWSNATTRLTALTTQDGVIVVSGTPTSRYLGTVYMTATGQTEDSETKRMVWNYYHRVPRYMKRVDSTDNWNYTTATIRQANASTSNQIAFVRGIAEDAVSAFLSTFAVNSSGGMQVSAGIGLDSTTTYSGAAATHTLPAASAVQLIAQYDGIPGIGYHFLAWLEWSAAVGTTTWYGDVPPTTAAGVAGTLSGRVFA